MGLPNLKKSLWGLALWGVFFSLTAQAQDYKSQTPNYNAPSVNFLGVSGLNLIPSARHDTVGTVRTGASALDPYLHTYLGAQIAKPLYVNFRQSYEISSFDTGVQQLYPGVDFKYRLSEETATRPEISFGANAALGHKRHASEYIVFSKRKNNFDFTGGVAWGRLAGKGHIKNPLTAVSHFDKPRDFNSEESNNIGDWFTGEEIGFFGGVEYFTPVKGLSFKADYAPIDGAPEQLGDAGFNAPPPWSMALNYKPFNFQPIDIAAGVVGGEKIFANISFQGDIGKWFGRPAKTTPPPALLPSRGNGDILRPAFLNLNTYQSSPYQLGHKARLMANTADATQEVFDITLKHKGLKGPNIKILRHDLEKSILKNKKSSEEIWRDISFEDHQAHSPKLAFSNFKDYFKNKEYKKLNYRFILDYKMSVAEQAVDVLYHTRLSTDVEKPLPFGLKLGYTAAVNLFSNIYDSDFLRVRAPQPIRGDEGDFKATRFALDRLYASWLHSVNKDLHIKLSAGYLEEMFGGFGGEILYRPFGKTFAVGAEGWQAKKRNAAAPLNFIEDQDNIFTGHLNLFYELPNQHTTFFVKAGQYLGEDLGATFGLQNDFKNGTRFEAFVTATDANDKNIFGEDSALYAGARLTLPIGNVPFVPQGSQVRITTAPFARDAGQILDVPDKLYALTEPVSYRHLNQNWSDLTR